jgi:hypothetical protein
LRDVQSKLREFDPMMCRLANDSAAASSWLQVEPAGASDGCHGVHESPRNRN